MFTIIIICYKILEKIMNVHVKQGIFIVWV